MSTDPRVRHILDQLLDSNATPEEACAPCPELLPEVRDRWQRVRRLRNDLDALFPPEGTEHATNDVALPHVPGHRVDCLLGRGGMGVVFRAWHYRLNRPVALKMMLAGAYAGPRERERFQREAEAVAGLRHPNVVQVHDAGDADGRPYFTMELVEGGCLAESLTGKPLSVDRSAELVGTLAAAVQVAHAAGVVHRDLKPANVLLTIDGTPKVGDFGLARRLSDETGLTNTGVALGTPSYMAPEQANGSIDAIGPPADVYALGAILSDLLPGRPPFRCETAVETVQQLLTHDPIPPSRLNPRVPRDLETICLKCLQKSPRLRYATAGELADDLGRFRRGEAITARPDGPVRRWVRRVRRRPLLTAAIAGVLVLTGALAGGTLWVASERATVARAVEEDLREMVSYRERSAWPEARVALGRAKARLGTRGPADLRGRIDRADADLALIAKLDAARMIASWSTAGVPNSAQADEAFEAAFREAGLWLPGDDLETVAARIAASDVSAALVNAIDGWADLTRDTARQDRLLRVTRLADPDPWRNQARDPAVWANKAALERAAAQIPKDEPRVPLFLLFAKRCGRAGIDPYPMLKQVHRTQPSDFWLNLRLGDYAYFGGRYAEAARFFQAAVVLRPDAAIAYNNLGLSLRMDRRVDEAIEYLKEACRIDPGAHPARINLAHALTASSQHAEAISHTRAVLRAEPDSAVLHALLARNLEGLKEDNEALAEHRRAAECDGRNLEVQRGLRNFFLRRGRTDEALAAWKQALALDPPGHDAWYGFAELCLYLNREDEYRSARRDLLARFANEKSPGIAERVSRTCLLRPADGDDLARATALATRAASIDRAKAGTSFAHYQFAQGLADFRQGRFDRAAATMRGDAAPVLGPAPKLILAMTLYRKGEVAEARKTLAAAVASHDWSPAAVRDQDGWIYHALRREAEALISADRPTKR
ncbi:serine threonine protein kinase : Tetratricopeptide repeat protein,protein kinase family protein OS=Singulisphaera acidiphila (strain ATCC BAA-1392 / DSM 18658 / VKM B-2454 / MOB10) GN=Sinac_4434 PE=3 SV=1: Pkinase: TPR_11: TPR_2 [Gemmata massiliana]|uniref:non-specific serine/threonine protein kinase n=1 Tax=Gemmata massiliana TaxID=1210884 RepID=A0A6P2D4L8_9BACT|nr:protein kinase [Gemmata massiliana]VTR96238.1 serine threonine protein kinase : Tetratricopeptide repeat protein,protein kinase family protein OS=Singulisphaera acidiphila (strain ATCC BAA-1392 / DSM 18658 / VKM B-2454 / MOB10) GN=Sinac_4434 PE=3 SV=1: Pkinase: TPR_11: TPR_2 [Gemmata massiliana]